MTDEAQDFFPGLIKDLLSAAVDSNKSFGEPTTLKFYSLSEEAEKEAAESYNKVTKAGFTVPMSWEALTRSQRNGRYEPVGNKYTQWLAWWLGKQVFRFWQFTESRLQKFRHFEGVWGYEWEAAEYREFKQKTRWVEDDEQST